MTKIQRKGYLVFAVRGEVHTAVAKLIDPKPEQVARLARRAGYDIKRDGHRKTPDDCVRWPLTAHVYTSTSPNGYGRAGSQFWQYPARKRPA